MGDRLLLHGGVDDHALKLGLLHRADGHRRLDRGLEQLLDAGLAEHSAESVRSAWRRTAAGVEVELAAEELEVDVLRPALDERLVALAVGVLQVEERDHQPHGQPRATGGADAGAGELRGCAEKVCSFDNTALAVAVRE